MVTEIYSYGALEIYRDVLNAIAMLSNDKSFIKMLITIGTVIGSFWAIMIMMFGDFVRPFTNWILPVAVIQMFLFMPGKQVHIIDVVQRKHAVVDNVPYGLAVVAGTVSKFSHMITQKVEAIFSLPNDLKYSQSGGVFGSNLMENMKVFTIYDENFAENMRQFVGQCVIYDLALGRKYTIQDLRNTHDMWRLVSHQASEARSFLWKDPGTPGEIVTCAEGVKRFNQQWQSQIGEAACKAGSLLFGSDDWKRLPVQGTDSALEKSGGFCRTPFAKEQIIKHLPLHFSQFVGASKSANQIMQQQMMISAFVDGQEYASRMVGNAPNYAVRKAYLQQNLNNNTIAKLAAHTLPMLRTSLELLCYSLFIFLIPIIAFPMGYKVLSSWGQVVLWLSMWPPVYAVLNLIMMSAQSMKTVPFAQSFNPEGISMVSSLGIQNISADISSQAGYLSTLVPFICIAIVKGVSQFMHLSSSLMATGQSAAASSSAEELSGNYNYGNVSLDNHSLGNTSMLHQNYNSSMSSGNFTQQLGHASITTDTSGDSIARIEQSQLPIAMNMAQNLAHSTHQAAAKELSQGHSIMQSVEKSLGSTIENMGTFGKTLSESTNIQEGFTESQQREVGQSMSQLQQAVDTLSKETGLSKDKSATLLASVGTPGIMKMGLGISGNSNNATASATKDQIQKAQSISQQYSFEDNLKISAQGMQNLSKHQNSDEVQSFVNNHQASVSETASQSESAQKHFDQSQRLSSEARYMEDNSVTMNRNMNDKFIGWLAHQPPAYRHEGHMGERAALMMISRQPELAQSYAQDFQRKEMAAMGYGSSSLPTEKDLRQSYESQSLGDVVQKDAVSQIEKEAHSLRGQNLHSKVEGIEERVTQGQSQGQQFMEQSKHEVLDDQRKGMNQEFNSRSNNIGLAEVIGDVVDTAVQTVARPAVKTLEWSGMMDMSGSSGPKIDYTNQLKEMSESPSLKNVSHIKDDDKPSVEGKKTSYVQQSEMSKGLPYQDPISAIESFTDTSFSSNQDSKMNVASSKVKHDFVESMDFEKDSKSSVENHSFSFKDQSSDIKFQERLENHNVVPYASKSSVDFQREEYPSIERESLSLKSTSGLRESDDVHMMKDQKLENVIPYAPQPIDQNFEKGYSSSTVEHQDQATEQPIKRAKVVVMKQESQNVIEDLNQPTTLKKEKK